MVAIMIVSNEKDRKTCSIILPRTDSACCKEFADVLTSKPQIKVIDGKSETAINYVTRAMEVIEKTERRCELSTDVDNSLGK